MTEEETEEMEAAQKRRQEYERWTQAKEMRFIRRHLGRTSDNLMRMEEGEREAYRVRCLEGYIKSLDTRTVWFDGVDSMELLLAARVELAEGTINGA